MQSSNDVISLADVRAGRKSAQAPGIGNPGGAGFGGGGGNGSGPGGTSVETFDPATLASVIQAKRKALNITGSDGDPVQYIQDNSPQFYAVVTEAESDPARRGAAADLLMFEQERLGVTPENRRVLSKSAAGAMAAELQALPGNERAQRIAELSAGYGDHSPRVAAELSASGLTPASKALLWAKDDPVLTQALTRMIDLGGHALRQGVDKEDLSVLSRSVDDALAGYDPANSSAAGSFASNLSLVELAGAAKNLALLNFRDSGDITASVARSVKQLAPGAKINVTAERAGVTQAGDAGGDVQRPKVGRLLSAENDVTESITLQDQMPENSELVELDNRDIKKYFLEETGFDEETYEEYEDVLLRIANWKHISLDEKKKVREQIALLKKEGGFVETETGNRSKFNLALFLESKIRQVEAPDGIANFWALKDEELVAFLERTEGFQELLQEAGLTNLFTRTVGSAAQGTTKYPKIVKGLEVLEVVDVLLEILKLPQKGINYLVVKAAITELSRRYSSYIDAKEETRLRLNNLISEPLPKGTTLDERLAQREKLENRLHELDKRIEGLGRVFEEKDGLTSRLNNDLNEINKQQLENIEKEKDENFRKVQELRREIKEIQKNNNDLSKNMNKLQEQLQESEAQRKESDQQNEELRQMLEECRKRN